MREDLCVFASLVFIHSRFSIPPHPFTKTTPTFKMRVGVVDEEEVGRSTTLPYDFGTNLRIFSRVVPRRAA